MTIETIKEVPTFEELRDKYMHAQDGHQTLLAKMEGAAVTLDQLKEPSALLEDGMLKKRVANRIKSLEEGTHVENNI